MPREYALSPAATLADVSDRAPRKVGAVRLDALAGGLSDGRNPVMLGTVDSGGNPADLVSDAWIFDQIGWNKLRGDLGGYLYQKPALLYSRRAPRRILLYDDFEGATLKWSQQQGTVTRDTTVGGVFAPTATLKGVTAAAAGNEARGDQFRAFQGLQKYVFEVWWAMTAGAVATPRRVSVGIFLFDGANSHILEVAYLKNLSTPQNKWQFSGDHGTYADVTGGAETLLVDLVVPYSWHYLRVHLDMSTGVPTLTELHTDTLDLTGLTHAGAQVGSATGPRITVMLSGTTDAAAAATVLFGYVLVSQNEA